MARGEKSSQVPPLSFLSEPGPAPALPCEKQVVWSRQAPYGDPPLSILGRSVDMTTRLADPVPSLHPCTRVPTGTSFTRRLPGGRCISTDSVKTLPPRSSGRPSYQALLARDGPGMGSSAHHSPKVGHKQVRKEGWPPSRASLEKPGLSCLLQPGADEGPPPCYVQSHKLLL